MATTPQTNAAFSGHPDPKNQSLAPDPADPQKKKKGTKQPGSGTATGTTVEPDSGHADPKNTL